MRARAHADIRERSACSTVEYKYGVAGARTLISPVNIVHAVWNVILPNFYGTCAFHADNSGRLPQEIHVIIDIIGATVSEPPLVDSTAALRYLDIDIDTDLVPSILV